MPVKFSRPAQPMPCDLVSPRSAVSSSPAGLRQMPLRYATPTRISPRIWAAKRWGWRRACRAYGMSRTASARPLHHVPVEVGDDPDRADDDKKDDQHAESQGDDIIRVIGPGTDMQKEDEVDTDLREREHNKPNRYSGRPQQICLRDDERNDRQQHGEPEPHRVGQVVGRRLILFDTRRPVVEHSIAAVHQRAPIKYT